MPKECYSLMSGGVDSTFATLFYILKKNNIRIHPIFFDYGQKARKIEWQRVGKIVERLKKFTKYPKTQIKKPVKLDLHNCKLFEWSESFLLKGNDADKIELENRNMVLLSILASYIKSKQKDSKQKIVITGFRGEIYDTKKSFMDAFNQLFKSCRTEMNIQVVAPLLDCKSKHQFAKWFSNVSEVDKLYELTWSCYNPINNQPCEICPACKKRGKEFKELGQRIRHKSNKVV